ncbi:aminotransferase class V-fold PLP-dependent enzyme [Azoarcus taiwanensis]|uniref:Aminotransferase class V-fold PLP-dependent enzyme n=1 Tax=Azoarcus taiwanensis TaxID=666964 RepID=A0A972FFR6_9RHOO|nr:aminotransferase class V-fold PLP-dependent enzyme [Azoarcus taiwanensis]NMG03885.1 aminotransferase class V-fold PLP-dependent enzyme [Azoarcus taiwanensis]
MPGLLPDVDPDGLLEYSVVFTDRSLNHMSRAFQQVMRELSATLKSVYRAEAVAIVPGGGSFAMESVARQFAGGARCLVVRNGWFSFRWTQILDMGGFATGSHVLKARPVSGEAQAAWAPAPVDEVVACIRDMRPDVVFAPHVETSAGIMLPDDYIRRVADAVHEVGGLMVLDCVASGAMWVDMQATGVDVLISAPQKGWSGTPCAGLVMLGERALARIDQTTSSSFAMDLKKWLQIMQAYESGGHAYHATLPTDGLVRLREAMRETEARGFEVCRSQQAELGRRVRSLLAERGFLSVAAAGFEAPGVVVSHTTDDGIHKGTKFVETGLQTAAGVPLQCDEPADFKTFRIGLFGLDKLADIDGTVARLAQALDRIGAG